MVMDSLRPTVAFLSGSGFPAWYWRDVRDALGLRSYVVDYLKGDATLTAHAQAIADGSGNARLVLVAHSIGGTVATQLCAIAPDRVAGILGIAAVFPPPGETYLDTLPRRQRLVERTGIRLLGAKPPRGMILKAYAKEVPEATARRLADEFEPESPRLFTGRVGTPRFPDARGYILTCKDEGMPPARQERYAAALGATYRREIASGHLPMLTNADELASLIREFVVDCPS